VLVRHPLQAACPEPQRHAASAATATAAATAAAAAAAAAVAGRRQIAVGREPFESRRRAVREPFEGRSRAVREPLEVQLPAVAGHQQAVATSGSLTAL
jgi:hypothetical protein